MTARTSDGRAFRILTVLDEYTRECLAILVERHISSEEVVDQLFHLFVFRRIPEYLRSDNGPEFTAKVIREWLHRLGVTTLFIELGSPWENGYVESFNGKLRDELINREIFTVVNCVQVTDLTCDSCSTAGIGSVLPVLEGRQPPNFIS